MRSILGCFIGLFLMIANIIPMEAYAAGIDETFKKQLGTMSSGDVLQNKHKFFGVNKSYALVVGVSRFKSFRDLKTNDPVKFKNYLLNEAGFDYVHLLTEEKVTPKRIRELMVDVFPQRLKKKDRFLFYWQGHGVTQNLNGIDYGYLPLAASTQKYSSMLDMNDLIRWDSRLRASSQSLYLIDACYSGLATVTGQAGSNVEKERRKSLQQFGGKSRQIITAGGKGQRTYILDNRNSSVFTTALLDGLRGEADNIMVDGLVTTFELQAYLIKRVRALLQGNKLTVTPYLKRLNDGGEGHFFFTSNSRDSQSTSKIKNLVSPQGQIKRNTGSSVSQHQHGARPHSHPLPLAGIAHKHGNSVEGSAIVNSEVQPKKMYKPLSIKSAMIKLKGGAFKTGAGGMNYTHLNNFSTNVGDYSIGKYEVTLGQFQRFIEATSYITDAERFKGKNKGCSFLVPDSIKPGTLNWKRPGFPQSENHPVGCVSYNDAVSYIQWLNKQKKSKYQLPTSVQFDYAARAGKRRAPKYEDPNAGLGMVAGGAAEPERLYPTKPVNQVSSNQLGIHGIVVGSRFEIGNGLEWTCSTEGHRDKSVDQCDSYMLPSDRLVCLGAEDEKNITDLACEFIGKTISSPSISFRLVETSK